MKVYVILWGHMPTPEWDTAGSSLGAVSSRYRHLTEKGHASIVEYDLDLAVPRVVPEDEARSAERAWEEATR